MRRLKVSPYVSLKESAMLLAETLHGEKYARTMMSQNHPERNKFLKAIGHDLYNVLASGEVETFLNDGQDPITLKSEHVVHLAFDFDIDGDSVFLGQLPGHAFAANINRKEFLTCVSALQANNTSGQDKTKIILQIEDWLTTQLRNQSPAKIVKSQLRNQAVRLFSAKAYWFELAWGNVTKDPLFKCFGQGGRRKKHQE